MEVAQLKQQIIVTAHEPQAEIHLVDPACGSAILSRVWQRSQVDMLLHEMPAADIQHEDSIVRPLHREDGELRRFQRSIANPPFSQSYTKKEIKFPERFKYRYCPEKKADLMFVQHMIASLDADGRMAVLVPHGVLFRGGVEERIRAGIIKDDILEAVLGLPSKLFCGTGVPACMLVINKAKAPARRGKVLLINAEAEFGSRRAQNFLRPRDIEKIAFAFAQFCDLETYAQVVSIAELEAQDWNLNIRRYVDHRPPEEILDLGGLVRGGVPCAAIEAKQDLFAGHDLPVEDIFVPSRPGYYDFAPQLIDRAAIRYFIESHPRLLRAEQVMQQAVDLWWEYVAQPRLVDLPRSSLTTMRRDYFGSFSRAINLVGVLRAYEVDGALEDWWQKNGFEALGDDLPAGPQALNMYQAMGMLADWWDAVGYDLRIIGNEGFSSALVPDDELVCNQFPEYGQALKDVRGRKAEFDRLLREAKRDEDVERLASCKEELRGLRRMLKGLEQQWPARLAEAHEKISRWECRGLVAERLKQDLKRQLGYYVAEQRRVLIAAVERWWDTYRVSMIEHQKRCMEATAQMMELLEGLGY